MLLSANFEAHAAAWTELPAAVEPGQWICTAGAVRNQFERDSQHQAISILDAEKRHCITSYSKLVRKPYKIFNYPAENLKYRVGDIIMSEGRGLLFP